MSRKQMAFWISDKRCHNDAVFLKDNPANRDDCLRKIRLLRQEFNTLNWDCHTADYYPKNSIEPDAVLFFDMPSQNIDQLLRNNKNIKKYVILNECPVILPRNFNSDLHEQFDMIFTWDESLVDNKRYHLSYFANHLEFNGGDTPLDKKKFCTLIAGNHKSSHPNELYSKRVEFIRWFEKNQPEHFDFYGKNWDKKIFYQPRLIRGVLNRIPAAGKLMATKYPSYKGSVTLKRDVLHNYKFSVCFENAFGFNGYVTEKIFDSFKAGCVPVYWGAPNIKELVPENCFIDFRDFDRYDDVCKMMSCLSDDEYFTYVENIKGFLKSEQAYPFSHECYAKKIAKTIALTAD